VLLSGNMQAVSQSYCTSSILLVLTYSHTILFQ